MLAPIAFSQRLLDSLGVESSTVCQIEEQGARRMIDLSWSSIYGRACEIAETSSNQKTMTRDEYFAIAGRDSRMDTGNSALEAGKEAAGGKVSSLTILWNESEPLCTSSTSTSRPRTYARWSAYKFYLDPIALTENPGGSANPGSAVFPDRTHRV